MKRDTHFVHMARPFEEDGLVNPPISRASTVLAPTSHDLYHSHGRRRHYGRGGISPHRELRAGIASLYGSDHCALAASGLYSVILAIHACVSANSEILVTDSVYGPVRKFCDQELKRLGISTRYYDPRIGSGIADLITDKTSAILLESPGSLTFELQDIPAITQVAHKAGVPTIIDDTWSAGVVLNPLDLGVDYAAQSLTKYAGGHSDLLMGAVNARGEAAERLKAVEIAYGGHVSPDDAYLVLRGLRTLGLRLDRSFESAMILAERLHAHAKVGQILHPAHPTHPDHAIYQRDFTGGSGCFSFVLAGYSPKQAEAFVDSLSLFGIGFSWGGFESLALPLDIQLVRTATPWHSEGALVRLSVGLEDVEDLWADLETGLTEL
ncbi:cystathionine beta-lyase [Woodsholea maritima]|uniref:cystathionine beta-lyase n=1 Tax=Woodsholea maritima TaxID=240237 RepID=UPI000368B98A|nr:cystathionine beta-lyase [Woodsholea maritima]